MDQGSVELYQFKQDSLYKRGSCGTDIKNEIKYCLLI